MQTPGGHKQVAVLRVKPWQTNEPEVGTRKQQLRRKPVTKYAKLWPEASDKFMIQTRGGARTPQATATSGSFMTETWGNAQKPLAGKRKQHVGILKTVRKPLARNKRHFYD